MNVITNTIGFVGGLSLILAGSVELDGSMNPTKPDWFKRSSRSSSLLSFSIAIAIALMLGLTQN